MANIKKIPAIERLIAIMKPIAEKINKKVENVLQDGSLIVTDDTYLAKNGKLEKYTPAHPNAPVDLAAQFNAMSLTEKDLFKHAMGMAVSDHTITRGAPETLEHYVQVVKQGGKVKYNFHTTSHIRKDLSTGMLAGGGGVAEFGDYADFDPIPGPSDYIYFSSYGGSNMIVQLKSVEHKWPPSGQIATKVALRFKGNDIPVGTIMTAVKGPVIDTYHSQIDITFKNVDVASDVLNSYWLYADGKWYDAETGGTEVTPTFSLPATLDTNHSLNIHY